jgi:hypothetical protein
MPEGGGGEARRRRGCGWDRFARVIGGPGVWWTGDRTTEILDCVQNDASIWCRRRLWIQKSEEGEEQVAGAKARLN